MSYPFHAVVVVDMASLLRSNGSVAEVPRDTPIKVHDEENGLGFVTLVLNGNGEAGRMSQDSYERTEDGLAGMTLAEFNAAVKAQSPRKAGKKPSKKISKKKGK